MEMMIFYESDDLDGLSDQVNAWFEDNPDIKIFDIKQTGLAPEIILNPKEYLRDRVKMHKYDNIDVIDSYLVITVWYEMAQSAKL